MQALRTSFKSARSLTQPTRSTPRLSQVQRSVVLRCRSTTSSVFPPRRTCQYTTRSVPPELEPEASSQPSSSESQPSSTSPETDTPHPSQDSTKWLSILSNTSTAPWLYTLPPSLPNRLKLSYTLLFQIIIYLSRPVSPSEAEQFLVAFGALPAPPKSEIGEARKAVGEIVNAICFHMGSIMDSENERIREFREGEKEVFGLVGALRVINDSYRAVQEDGDPVKDLEGWRRFWERAQPVLLDLGMKLDERGYGLDLDELKKEEEEAKKKEAEQKGQ